MASWYEVVTGASLEQADILLRCPVARVEVAQFPLPDELDVTSSELDLIVLTQSCDLENKKVEEVLFAAVFDYAAMALREAERNPAVRSKKWRTAVIRGDTPSYSLLPERTEPPAIGWSIVDFHHLFSLPKAYAESFADASGERLRLVAPYREHLAQAYARYMMRVGLPLTLTEFEDVAPPAIP